MVRKGAWAGRQARAPPYSAAQVWYSARRHWLSPPRPPRMAPPSTALASAAYRQSLSNAQPASVTTRLLRPQVDAIRAKAESEHKANPQSRGDYFEHVLHMHS